jgi:hypothetical protein
MKVMRIYFVVNTIFTVNDGRNPKTGGIIAFMNTDGASGFLR